MSESTADLFPPGVYAAAQPDDWLSVAGSWPPETVEEWRLKRLKTGAKKGYFAPPGTGPLGETCKTCSHATRQSMAGTWWKCLRTRPLWTGGLATDISPRAPACRGWVTAAAHPALIASLTDR